MADLDLEGAVAGGGRLLEEGAELAVAHMEIEPAGIGLDPPRHAAEQAPQRQAQLLAAQIQTAWLTASSKGSGARRMLPPRGRCTRWTSEAGRPPLSLRDASSRNRRSISASDGSGESSPEKAKADTPVIGDQLQRTIVRVGDTDLAVADHPVARGRRSAGAAPRGSFLSGCGQDGRLLLDKAQDFRVAERAGSRFTHQNCP